MAMRCTLSDWEVDEMLALHRGGWPTIALATFYGITERTVSRILRRERDRKAAGGRKPLRAARSPAGAETGQTPKCGACGAIRGTRESQRGIQE